VLFELAADEGAIWGEEHDTDPDAPLALIVAEQAGLRVPQVADTFDAGSVRVVRQSCDLDFPEVRAQFATNVNLLNNAKHHYEMIRNVNPRIDLIATTDKSRPKAPPLPPELRSEVEALKVVQEEIRDSLKKIAASLSTPEDDAVPDIPGLPGLPREFRQ